MENDIFVNSYLESEPYIRELVENWLAGRFKAVLASLGRYSVSIVTSRPLLCAERHLYIDSARSTATSRPASAEPHPAYSLKSGRAVLQTLCYRQAGEDGHRLWLDSR